MALTPGPRPAPEPEPEHAFREPTPTAPSAPSSVDGDWLYLGGDFTVVNGTDRDQAGQESPFHGGRSTAASATTKPLKAVRDLLVVGGNSLYVVGDFTEAQRNGPQAGRGGQTKTNGAA